MYMSECSKGPPPEMVKGPRMMGYYNLVHAYHC